MREPYRRKPESTPEQRRLVIVVGAIVTAAILAGLIWSVTRWPTTCGRRLDPATYVDAKG
jgi:hypothetical protein